MNLTQQLAYLKHVGELQNAKVTIVTETDCARYEIRIRDHVFYTFQDALAYLKRDAQSLAQSKEDSGEII